MDVAENDLHESQMQLVAHQQKMGLTDMLSNVASNSVQVMQTTFDNALWLCDLFLTTAEAAVGVLKNTNDRAEVMVERVAVVKGNLEVEATRAIITAFRIYEMMPDVGQTSLVSLLARHSTPTILAMVHEEIGDERFADLQRVIAQNQIRLIEQQ
jgi:hypothetical protein